MTDAAMGNGPHGAGAVRPAESGCGKCQQFIPQGKDHHGAQPSRAAGRNRRRGGAVGIERGPVQRTIEERLQRAKLCAATLGSTVEREVVVVAHG